MSAAAGATTVWQRSDTVLVRRTPRAVLLAAAPGADPRRLEGAAIAVWDALAEPTSDDRLVEAIAAQFAVEAAEVRAPVVGAREALAAIGAVVRSDG